MNEDPTLATLAKLVDRQTVEVRYLHPGPYVLTFRLHAVIHLVEGSTLPVALRRALRRLSRVSGGIR